jgi:hypothetical protein
MLQFWKCLLCSRDNLQRPGQPHYCNGQYRVHHFKRDAKRKGLEKPFIKVGDK